MAHEAIPNRPIFRAQEVCELADVQAYVLRTWEAEFPDLGFAKSPTGPRLYRRSDVERVLRIKHLLFVDGLTLAGARRRLTEEGLTAPTEQPGDAEVAALLNEATRQELQSIRRGLTWILGVLSGQGVTAEDFVLKAPASHEPARGRASNSGKPAGKGAKSAAASKPSRPARKAARARK